MADELASRFGRDRSAIIRIATGLLYAPVTTAPAAQVELFPSDSHRRAILGERREVLPRSHRALKCDQYGRRYRDKVGLEQRVIARRMGRLSHRAAQLQPSRLKLARPCKLLFRYEFTRAGLANPEGSPITRRHRGLV